MRCKLMKQEQEFQAQLRSMGEPWAAPCFSLGTKKLRPNLVPPLK